MSINNDFPNPLTFSWGNILFSSGSDNFTDRKEYSNCKRHQLLLRKAQPPMGTKESRERQTWKLLSKSWKWTPKLHTYLKWGRLRNYCVCKKFYLELQSQDNSTMTPVKLDRQYISETEDWHSSTTCRTAEQTSVVKRPRSPLGIYKWICK